MRFLCIFLTVFATALAEVQYTRVVNTASGPIVGRVLKSVRKSAYYGAFLGVPFAEPPVGPLRFKVSLRSF